MHDLCVRRRVCAQLCFRRAAALWQTPSEGTSAWNSKAQRAWVRTTGQKRPLWRQVGLTGRLEETRLAGEDIAKLLALRGAAAAAAEAETRVDIGGDGSSSILWLNDLENDLRYARWQHELRDLLQPVFPGQVCGLCTMLLLLKA